MKMVFGIEGLDRLGKSTLINGIRNQLGYYEVIHFGKPQVLDIYRVKTHEGMPNLELRHYQYQSFLNSMMLATSGARIIFDRWHLGEYVYSPMYRHYSGSYVFEMETAFNLRAVAVRLILLTEDFEVARHFKDDGESLGAIENRKEEQARFIDAFALSNISDKRIINVTDRETGGFRDKKDILAEALA